NELLRAPVQDLGDVQLVLRLTVNLVDPAELLRLLAGFAEHSQHGAVQRQLVDPPRKRVGDVQILRRSGRDADRPRRARRHRAARLRRIGRRADRRTRAGRYRHRDLDLAQELAVAVEDLHAAVAAIADVDVSLRVRRDGVRGVELAGTAAGLAPR